MPHPNIIPFHPAVAAPPELYAHHTHRALAAEICAAAMALPIGPERCRLNRWALTVKELADMSAEREDLLRETMRASKRSNGWLREFAADMRSICRNVVR